jgi:hypothetical protein
MSVDAYAAVFAAEDGCTIVNPVVPFNAWKPTRKRADVSWADYYGAQSAEEVQAMHEPNPDHIPGIATHLHMGNHNARTVFRALDLELCEEGGPSNFPIGDVHAALMRRLNGSKPLHTRAVSVERGTLGATLIDCGASDAYVKEAMDALLAIVLEGRKREATHIAVC